MNILTYRETLSSDDLSYKCTNTLKTLGRAEQCSAKVQRNVDKARLINRRTYLRTENVVKTLRTEKGWEEKLLQVRT